MGRKKKNKLKDKVSTKPIIKKGISFDQSSLSKKYYWLSLFIFIVAALVLYHKSLFFGFVLDDKIVLSENKFVQNGFSGISELLFTDSFQGYFGEQLNLLQGGRYRPLSLISFAIEYQFLGENSHVNHLVNILLYGISVFVAFITLRKLFEEKERGKKVFFSLSFLVCVVFLVHPIHSEAVANIKGRDEIMSFLFSMLSLSCAITFVDRKKIRYLLSSMVCLFLGMLSKENTITFLAVIPLALLLFRKEQRKQMAIVTGALLLVTIIYLVFRYQVMGYLLNENTSTDLMNNPFLGMTGIQKTATILYTLLVYLNINIAPFELTHDYYPYHIPVSSFADWQVILSIVLHVLLLAVAVYNFKRQKVISFAILYYFICMTIVSNVVVGVGTFMNERFAFSASLGFCILLVLVMYKILNTLYKKENLQLSLIIISPLIVLFSLKTISRIPAWENEFELNKAAIKISKNSARANSFMATALFNKYQSVTTQEEKKRLIDQAEPYAKKSVEIHPTYKNGYIMMAGIAAEQFRIDRKLDKLLNTFLDIIKNRPDIEYVTTYVKYLNEKGQNVEELKKFYLNVYNELYSTKNSSWAIHYLLIALELNPNDIDIRKALVNSYTQAGRLEDAERYK